MFLNLNTGALGVKATLSETLALAQKHGFKGIDFSITEVTEIVESQGTDAVHAMFNEAGQQAGAWGMPVNYRGDDATWQASLDELPRYAKAAQALGYDRCTTFIMPCDDDRDYAENFAYHVARLQPPAQVLADHDIRLGLEWVGPKTLRDSKKYPFICTMDGARALGGAIGTGNVGLLVDMYHAFTSHLQLDEIRKLPNSEIVAVHVNDAIAGVPADEQQDLVRDLPGVTGVMDLTTFLNMLREAGYDGPVTAEPFSARLKELSADDAVAMTADAMRTMWLKAGL